MLHSISRGKIVELYGFHYSVTVEENTARWLQIKGGKTARTAEKLFAYEEVRKTPLALCFSKW